MFWFIKCGKNQGRFQMYTTTGTVTSLTHTHTRKHNDEAYEWNERRISKKRSMQQIHLSLSHAHTLSASISKKTIQFQTNVRTQPNTH